MASGRGRHRVLSNNGQSISIGRTSVPCDCTEALSPFRSKSIQKDYTPRELFIVILPIIQFFWDLIGVVDLKNSAFLM
jgi:hypothetical protein